MTPPTTTGSMPHGLQAAHNQVRDELTRADTKATTLLSLVGAALAGVIALTSRDVTSLANVLLWLTTVPIGASVLLLLSAIHPRLNAEPAPGTWLYAATVGPATLIESYRDGEDAQMIAAHDVCVLSTIARTKYRCIQAAVYLLVTGLCVLAVALIVTAVTS
jgi:hypothetical protein